jgi:hypothetical protein
MYLHSRNALSWERTTYIIHILHDFEGDIPEYFPRGDRKALECYHPMPKAEDDITLQGFPVTEGKIFW